MRLRLWLRPRLLLRLRARLRLWLLPLLLRPRLRLWLRSRSSLWLRPLYWRPAALDLWSRLRHRLRSRSRHHSRLRLGSLILNLRSALRLRPHCLRPDWLRFRRIPHRRWLRPLSLRLTRHSALVLQSLLLRGTLQLLRRGHLLTSSFALRLLLLTHQLTLVLLLRRLANSLTLRLRIHSTLRTLLSCLLLPQLLHLLTRPTITASCLSSQISHLFLSRLFRCDVRRLTLQLRLLSCCCSLVIHL